MSRAATVVLLAVGVVPWLYLVMLQAFAAFLILIVGDGLGECFDTGALPTMATFWLALAPLPVGVAAIVTGLRRLRMPRTGAVGLVVLAIGSPLLSLSTGQLGCPGRVIPLDDADSGSVPVNGWTVAAYLVVAVCFGVVLLSAMRRAA